MRLSIDSIALFFRENWQFLLSMMPVAVILFLLFRKLFQLAKAGRITAETALRFSIHEEALARRLELEGIT